MKKKKLQQFLSMFLSCILAMNTPMSVLASNEVFQPGDTGTAETAAQQDEFSTLPGVVFGDGGTAVGETVPEAEGISGEVIPEAEEVTGEMIMDAEGIAGEAIPEAEESIEVFSDETGTEDVSSLFADGVSETEKSVGEELFGSEESQAAGIALDTSNLAFDIAKPDGYVTVSVEDYAVRSEDAGIEDTELYGEPVGVIIGATEVPFQTGDSIADVTVRLFEAMGLDYDCTGTAEEGFYLSSINDFELNDVYYPTFGEFDAGNMSGWCVRLNNWHINQGTSDFEVEDEDVVRWLYTCEMGADIGADFSTRSADITGVKLTDDSLTLVYEEASEKYICEVPGEMNSLAFEVELENYASVVTVKVDGTEVKYRPNKAIAVKSNSTIEISSALEYMDAENNNQITTYTDSFTIQLSEKANQAPKVREGAIAAAETKAGKEVQVDLSTLFEDADSDPLTYHAACEAMNLDQDLEGSVFSANALAAGTYELIFTATDGKDSVSHTVTLTVKDNAAPTIKAEFAETKSKTYVYSSSYVYIYMDDLFEDADGDTLSYEATCNGEKTEVQYNTWSQEYYIIFSEKPVIKEFKIRAYDGAAYSEEFTAKCIGTTAAITAEEDSPLMSGDRYFYYVKGSAENDTFALNYKLDVDTDIQPEWTSNQAVLTSNGDGTFTVGELTSRQQATIGVCYGKDQWNSPLYLGTQYIYLLPELPAVEDITLSLPEHADHVVPAALSNVLKDWYTNEFNYEFADPSIASLETNGYSGWKITPKALGTTKVTATFKYDESIKFEFQITVTGRSLQIKDQPGTDSVIYEKGKTVQMEVLGAQEGETFTWTSADDTVASIDETGLVTLHGLGQTYLTAVSSLTAEEVPLKASMYLQVKESEKVYLEDLALTQYGYFGHISAKAGFNSAQLNYDWDLEESRYSYNQLQFTPYFDGENLKAILHYQVSGGEYQTMELTAEKAVDIRNGLNPGENIVKIDVYPKENEEKVTTYTFRIFRPYNPTNTISSMTVYPNGETALAYPTYKGYKEGTIYQWDTENNDFVAGWGGRPSTGWSSSRYDYKVFVFGSRSESISVAPNLGYVNERVMIYVDGEPLEEAVHSWKSSTIPVDEDGAVLKFHVNSEKYHTEQLAAGVENPFENPEKIYTLSVENVTPLGIDSKILSAELSGGEFYKPGFRENVYTTSGLIPNDQSSAELTFTVPADIDVYKGSVNDANKLTAASQDEEGNNVYQVTLTIAGTYATAYSTTNIILQVTDEETGEKGQTQYSFTISRRGAKDIYPDSVADYLCIGSQYTNAGNYGNMPERTLKNGGGTLSLGNFGGYIVYKYDNPIVNNPNNPYGVDFIVYGNSFGNGGHEPGYVQVSKDGKTWYTLAGADHYEDFNDWGFSMTYTNNNGKSSWTDSDGESGEIYSYPKAASYPYYNWTEAAEQSITVSGYRLNSSARDVYGSAAAVLPDFGYVDVNTNGAINGISNNPYDHPGVLKDGGDQFDLDWAVDANGMPVKLDSISYIRVATASSIYAGSIGEKSTEVSAVTRVVNTGADAVGETSAPVSVLVNGTEVLLPENGGVQTVAFDMKEVTEENKTVLTIDVNAAEGASVYINGEGGAVRNYVSLPDKGIVRLIVQEGEKEPYICYLKLNHIHKWDAGTVTREATCSEAGEMLYHCSCKETKTERIPEKGHSGTWKTVSKATVFKEEVQKRICTVCGVSEQKNVGKALKPVLELPGKLKYLQKGHSVKFAVTMARGDSIASVKSSRTQYLKVSGVAKKSGKITLKGLKAGTSNLTITLASGKTKTYKVQVTNGLVKTKSLNVNNVSGSKLTLKKGKTFILDAVKAPFSSTQKITYQTSNKKIVSVSSTGELKALKAGKAVITVTSGSKKVEITVTVPGITNVKSAVTVKQNKTLTLKPKTYGLSGTVTYTSSDKSVAKISSKGKITGVAPGKAVITVSRGGQKVKTTVTVPGIASVESAVTLKKNKTLTLKPELYGIRGSVTYQTSNKKIATVTSKGKIKGIKKGTAKITVKAGDFTKTVIVTVE